MTTADPPQHHRSQPVAITLWPASQARSRRVATRTLTLAVVLFSLSIIVVVLSLISPIAILPNSALFVMQRSDLSSVWARATLELSRRERASQLTASETTQFRRDTYRVELVGPDAVPRDRTFELALRITPRTPEIARAIVTGQTYSRYVEYQPEQLQLTYADGSPLPEDTQHYFDDSYFAGCYRIADGPNVHGRPVTLPHLGHYRIRLSGVLLLGCPLSCVPDNLPFVAEHEIVVAGAHEASGLRKALELPGNILEALKSISVWDNGVISMDFGTVTDSIWELKLSVRRSGDEEFFPLGSVLAVGKTDTELPREWTKTETGLHEGDSVDIRISGGFDVLGRPRFWRWLPTALPCRYWEGQLVEQVYVRARAH